jgi:phosphoenolpyruvate-protein phosphotransferase (PTS system enzyme I)
MSDPSSPGSLPGSLHGTPVVPGVAYGPALVVRGEVSPEAIERFDGASLDEETALTAYDDAADAVATGFTDRSDKA